MAFTGAKSDTYENALLDYIFRGQTSPVTGTNLYIGIFTGDGSVSITSPDGGDTTNLYLYEPTGGSFAGYQRIQVSTVFGTAASAGSISNDALIDFWNFCWISCLGNRFRFLCWVSSRWCGRGSSRYTLLWCFLIHLRVLLVATQLELLQVI